MDAKQKVIVIGLDGATFKQLGPMMDEGKLPAFSRLVQQGASGVLESTVPPTTPPAWSSMLTGVNPGRHGIFDFRLTPHAGPERPLIDLGKMKSMKVWEALERGGMSSGFLGVPVMYPPAPLKGWMISGIMTPSRDAAFTYPEGLKQELLDAFPDYVIDVDIPRYDNTFWEDMAIFLGDLEKHTRVQIDAFFHLWDKKPVDFLMAVFVATDRIGHLLWKFLDSAYPRHFESELGRKVRERTAGIYAMIDGLLEEAARRAEKQGAMLLVMSDHGFGATDGYFNANRLLEEIGLLRVKKEVAFKKRMFYRAWKIGDSNFITKILPKGFQRSVRGKIRRGRSSFLNDLEPFLDMEGTSAFYASIPCHGFFIRRRGEGAVVESDAEAAKIRDRIKKALTGVVHPDGGKMVTGLWDREELYNGPMTQYAPDVVFSMRDFSIVPRPLLGATDLYRPAGAQPNGFHRMDGLVVLWGDGVAAGAIEGARMIDIAPTIIDRMGMPRPPMVEGKSLLMADKKQG
ncbi:MAG: alkaline phosphatase family protein [Pseudomonadota bacterium]